MAREGNAGERPLLLPHDVTIEDPISGAIEIRDILTAVKSTGTKSVFLFIDACSQDITSLFDGPSLSSLLLDVAEARGGCFFAAIAGHRTPAYEGGSRAGGLFTATLFDSIESVEAEDGTTIGNLATTLESRCSDKANLRVALIGSANVWLFPPTKGPVERQVDQDGELTFKRAGLLQALAKRLRDRPRTAVFLWGPSSSGKTVTLRQLLNDVPAAVYVSCQDSDANISFLLERVGDAFSDQYPGFLPHKISQDPSSACLESVRDRGGGYVLLDHVERVGIDAVDSVSTRLSQYSISVLAATNMRPPPNRNPSWMKVPPLSADEVREWLLTTRSGIHSVEALVQRYSGRNPKDLILHIHRCGTEPSAANILDNWPHVRMCLHLTRGYGDLGLFYLHFRIDQQAGNVLANNPFITRIGLWHYPHDELVRLKDRVPTDADIDTAIGYLHAELLDHSGSLQPAERLVDLVEIRTCVPTALDRAIATALDALAANSRSERISGIATHLIGQIVEMPETARFLLKWSSERGSSALFEMVTNRHHFDPFDPEYCVIKARTCWWAGNYDECVRVATGVVETPSLNKCLASSAELEAGIGYFFLGEWTSAIESFSRLELSQDTFLRTRHWARAMKATALGLRGIEIPANLQLLRRSAGCLIAIGDLVGAGIAYGNAAEIACKAGLVEESESLLDCGLRIATSQQAAINVLEHHRVRMHLLLRNSDPKAEEVLRCFELLLNEVQSISSKMERMQVLNTLATVSLIQGKLDLAKSLIDDNGKLVIGNLEYEIYWRWNRTMYCAIRGERESAGREFDVGLALARKSGNILAIKHLGVGLPLTHQCTVRFGKSTTFSGISTVRL